MHPADDDFFHLTYCSNIHPGEEWGDLFAQLQTHIPSLKEQLAPERPFGIGLRLGSEAADALQGSAQRDAFRSWLDQNDCYVFTINGFPYGSFHGEAVKDRVYAPDWRTRERVEYTKDLASLLADLLPPDLEGSISTSPISYKPWISEDDREEAFQVATRHLAEATAHLVRIRRERDTLIHLGLEPEPDCLIENTEETVRYFEDWLFARGSVALADELLCSTDEADALLRDHVGVCYDTCHFAVEYEAPTEALDRFEAAGIKLSKVQLSAAIRMDLRQHASEEISAALSPFAESTYLHQVVEQQADGSLRRYPDLPDALSQLDGVPEAEWRIHYHVPLFVDQYGSLQSTQPDLAAALEEVLDRRTCPHLEIETYTWEVLPEDLQRDLGTSIQREFEWVLSQIS